MNLFILKRCQRQGGIIIRGFQTLYQNTRAVDWLISFSISSFVGYLFYKNIAGIVLLSPCTAAGVRILKKEREKKREWNLTLQFKDGICSLTNAMVAGYSIENAFGEAIKDLRYLYDEQSDIIMEFQLINQQLKLSRNVESLLMEFGERTGIEDIINFAEVVTTAKRTGGDLIKIMKTTSSSINDKVEVQREITTLVAAKRLEGNIMSVIPLGIIVYLNLCMPEFMEPVYTGILGRGIMSIALVGYVLAIIMLNKIITIKI